jgi:hypothetical protein
VSAIVLISVHRLLNLDPVWVLLFVPFSLAMTGALILFHFLSSSASINRDAYKIGGAIAGFMVLFSTFYNLSREPFLGENAAIKLGRSPLGNKIAPILDRYNKVRRRKGGAYPLSHLYGHFKLVRLCRLGHDVPWVNA